MNLEVRLFAVCRERCGRDRISVRVPENATVADLRLALSTIEALAPLLPICRIAVNQNFAIDADPLGPNDELAVIPPVSGGSGIFAALRDAPISISEAEAQVAHAGAGAIVGFTGTVRDRTGEHQVVALEYEAYLPMAERALRGLAEEVVQRWPTARAAVIHRLGRVGIGEASVVIAVSSPHRADAFEGCRHLIERLKQDVPIWKRELRQDGSVWVGIGS